MNNSKKRLRADLVLILALLCLAGGGFAFLHAQRTEGGAAVVYVDGVRTAEYPLARDCTVTLTGWDGGWNQLVIQDGKAQVTGADCPDGLCTRMHAICYSGESIICLPHRVVIQIEEGTPSGVDVY